MVKKTPRLNLDDFEPGDKDWDHSDTVNALDEHAIVRGPIADRPAEGDYDDELYHAIDQGITWRWDETAGDWQYFSGQGSSDQPVPGTTHLEAVSTDELLGGWDYLVTDTTSLNNALSNLSDGETIAVVGTARSDSWLDIDGVSDVKIKGLGKDQSRIKTQDGTQVGLFRLGASATVHNITFEDITLDGNAPNITDETVVRGDGIRAEDVQGLDIRNVRIVDTPNNNNNNDADASVGIGAYYPSTDITIENYEIDNPTAYRAIEVTADNVEIRHGYSEDVAERHISLASMRVDNRVAGDVRVEDVEMVTGSGNTTVGSFVAFDGGNYDGSGSYSGSAEGSDIGEVYIRDIRTTGGKRSLFAARAIGSNASKIDIDGFEGSGTNEHGMILNQGSASSNPDTIIDVDVSIRNVDIETTGQNAIRLGHIREPEIHSPTVRDGRVAISLEDCPDYRVTEIRLKNCLLGFSDGGSSDGGQLRGGLIDTTDHQAIRNRCPNSRVEGVDVKDPSQSGSGSYDAVHSLADDVAYNGLTVLGGGMANHGINVAGSDNHTTACIVENVTNNQINDSGTGNTFGANDATVV
ncbi:hypothetical protein [Natrinema thermotolerans]